jgi:hypothetical protein
MLAIGRAPIGWAARVQQAQLTHGPVALACG